jgi:hypothetical protein
MGRLGGSKSGSCWRAPVQPLVTNLAVLARALAGGTNRRKVSLGNLLCRLGVDAAGLGVCGVRHRRWCQLFAGVNGSRSRGENQPARGKQPLLVPAVPARRAVMATPGLAEQFSWLDPY